MKRTPIAQIPTGKLQYGALQSGAHEFSQASTLTNRGPCLVLQLYSWMRLIVNRYDPGHLGSAQYDEETDVVYFNSMTKRTAALEAATGRVVWEFKVRRHSDEAWSRAGTN